MAAEMPRSSQRHCPPTGRRRTANTKALGSTSVNRQSARVGSGAPPSVGWCAASSVPSRDPGWNYAEDGIVLRGSAAVFDQQSVDLGGFVEVIKPGFFRDVLGGDTAALWNHRTDFVLGRTTASPPSLSLRESDSALDVEIRPADNARNRDWIVTPIERREIRHMSFAFRTTPDGDSWSELPDGRLLRTLLPGGCIDLSDVSPVTRPAYQGTEIGLRSLEAWRGDREGNPELRLEVLRHRARMLLAAGGLSD